MRILYLVLLLVFLFPLLPASAGHAEEKIPVTRVTDYLFEITVENHEQTLDDAKEYFKRYNPHLGGCSSVQNGFIRGRNYDWTYDEEPEFIIHVPANDAGRHASIGVAATTEMTAAEVEAEGIGRISYLLPYLTLDGINDAGLTVNINVVNYGEKGQYVMKNDDPSDDTCPIMVPRLLLDSCGSIDEALAMMETMDIFSVGSQEEAHYMISGRQSPDDDTFNTVVVELIPDENGHYQLSVLDYNRGDFVDGKPIMTNFHLTGFDGSVESLTRRPMGYERYLILSRNYGEGTTVPGMLDLMKKVYYTHCYDLYADPFWYSEYTNFDLSMDMRGETCLNGDPDKAGPFADEVRKGFASYSGMKRDKSIWQTVHTSVYDIGSRTLYMTPQEGGHAFVFPLQ